MPKKITERMTSSQFNMTLRSLGYYDYDDLAPSMTAAKAVLQFGHSETHAARMFGISTQAVSWAVRRMIKAESELPGKHRLCPGCGRTMEGRQ